VGKSINGVDKPAIKIANVTISITIDLTNRFLTDLFITYNYIQPQIKKGLKKRLFVNFSSVANS